MQKLLIATSLLFTACHNPNYCAGNPDNNCNETGDGSVGSDGPEAVDCTVSGCSGVSTGGVCDTGTKACVVCTATIHDACAGTAPVCSTTDTCRACVTNSECSSDACMPDGSCAAATDVAYVDASKSGTTCARGDECHTVSLALATNKSIIRVTGKTSESVLVPRTLFLLGDHDVNNAITSGVTGASGTVISVGGALNLTMVDMAIDGGGTATYGLNNSSSGTVVANHSSFANTTTYGVYSTAGTVNLHRAMIALNKIAGINLTSSTFNIDNSFIVHNGDINNVSALGGIYLSLSTGTLSFSTIAKNISLGSGPHGVNCSTATTLAFSNNIVYYNSNGPFTGNCGWTYSELDSTTAPTGAGNITSAPTFKDLANDDFHLDAGSPGENNGSGSLKLDFDNQQRPMGTGPDIGADEVQ